MIDTSHLPLLHRVGAAARALAAVVAPNLVGAPYGLLASIFPAGGQPPSRATQELIAAYNESPWLRSVINRIATSVSNAEFFLEVVRKNGEPAKMPRLQRGQSRQSRRKMVQRLKKTAKAEVERVEEHPLLDLLEKPNFMMSGQAMLKLVQIYLEIVGDAFLIKQRNDLGMPIGLWPVPPNWIKSTPTPADPFYRLQTRASAEPIPYTEIIWLRELNPQNPYGRGSGIAKAVDDEIETDEYSSKFIKQFFYNNARPDVLIYGEGIKSEKQVNEMRQGWMQKHQGFWRSFLPHFMAGNFNIHQFSQDMQHLQFVPLREWERNLIQQVWNVPPESLGITENSNRATIQASDFLLNKNVVDPRVSLIRNELQMQLVIDYDERLSLEYESVIDEDWEFIKNVAAAAPWTRSMDEWRELQALEEMPDGAGKFFMMPYSGTPTYLDEGLPPPSPIPGVDDDEEDAEIDPPEEVEGKIRRVFEHLPAEGFDHLFKNKPEVKLTARFGREKSRFVDVEPGDESYRIIHAVADKFFTQTWQTFFDTVDEAKERIGIAALEDALNQHNADRAIKVIDVDRLTAELEGRGDVLRRQGLTAVYVRTFDLAARAEAKHLDQRLAGKSSSPTGTKADPPAAELTIQTVFDLTNPVAVDTIQRSVGKLIKEINGGQRDAVRAIIEYAFTNGLPPARSAKLIQDVVGLTKNQAQSVARFEAGLVERGLAADVIERRVDRYAAAQLRQRSMNIARTETINAANFGQRELWRQAIGAGHLPAEQQRKWIVTPDDRLCEDTCEPTAGQIVGVNEPFTLPDGRQVMNPGGSAHPKCRCGQRLVL